jgi:mRNA interferase MazF
VPARRDICLARFPFTDLTGVLVRPVLVLAEMPGVHRDFLVMFISSQLSQAVPAFDMIVDPSHSAFARSGLKVPSVFRIAKVATLSEALVLGTLGHLELGVFDEIIRRLVRLIRTGRAS